MTLRPGLMLGPYEIQSLIGSGGMGEVYRAIDTRLQRPVAIKVLSDELTSSAIAMERFQREARTASLLNHPHICTIYDVGITQPLFIAMELLEGESLQHRLRSGPPLDLPAMLAIALATTEGLEAAHAHGVIHRDVKPANIFLTAHGPKLLDFGLAKASAMPTAVSHDRTKPAEVLQTASGVTLGTVAYMSPEQLRGENVDARTDVFSLGLVLYEMATRRPAFTGTTAAALSGAILYEQPRPPSEIVRELPQRLNDIILKAIEKDRDDRYQTVADLRADLRKVKRELDSQSAHPTAVSSVGYGLRSGSEPKTRQTRRRSPVLVICACLMIGAIAGVTFYLYSRSAASRVSSLPSLDRAHIAQLTSTGDAERAAIAPDGNYLAYVRRLKGEYSLHVGQIASAATTEIVRAEHNVGLWGVTVSPDGASVDYVRRVPAQSFELWRVPFLGGTSRRLLTDVASPIGWSRDGRRFAFIRVDVTRGATSIVLVDAATFSERTLAERQRPAQFISLMIGTRPSIAPAWSPDGRTLAVPGVGGGADPVEGDVNFFDVDTGTPRRIPLPSNAIRGLVWFADDTLLLNAASSPDGPLQLQRLSYPSGDLSALTRDVSDYIGLSLAPDGRTLVCTRRERRTELALIDATGNLVVQGPVMAGVKTLNWAADRVLYGPWTWLPGDAPLELLRGAEDTNGSPDGRTLVFTRAAGLWKADATGGAITQLLTADAFHPVVTADNRTVVFVSARTGQQSLWVISIDGGEPRQLAEVYAASPGVDISPDGKSIVLPSHHLDQRNVALICDLPDCTARKILPRQGSTRLRWTPDGRSIAYIEPGTQTNLFAVPVAGGAPRQLTHFLDREIADFDWSPDGKRLAVARVIETNDIVVMKGLVRE